MIDPTWIATLAADPTFVLSSEPNWLDYAAPLIAMGSAGVIAWQAWLTRKSVEESKNAVDVAQRALTENQLARLEGGVPRIWVTSEGSFGLEAQKLVNFRMEEVAATEVFRMPSHADLILRTNVPVSIYNDGPGSVQLHASKPLVRKDGRRVGKQIFIQAGDSFIGRFSVSKTVSNWVDLSKQTDDRRADDLQIAYHGPKDADVDELHEVVVFNSLLSEDQTKVGDWLVNGPFDTNMSAAVSPAIRTYWRSRKRSEEFDLT
ncbi:hypothetical protein IFU30_10945 [Plantibacter sp. CFBP 8798]|uniref:hypothetical protein n=1 Tax=Plantibacter sp. CFBP 8798 TaxID=2775268 RepID=UPI001785BACF|nr:hypothetical protein [Plantibacter sp. CFBP 8798]MBD8466784.1 hypothetical protein [Plantibacter sp. CFBP 8798]